MATKNDDDILTAPVPAPDDVASSSERMHAKTFGELVDKTIAGRTPAAMSADDRALLEVATVIRAASGNAELPAGKRRSIVEDALRQAVGGVSASTSGAVTPISRGRARRWAPWAVAAGASLVAVAAVLLLWLRGPERVTVEAPVAHQVPTTWKSRPADPLIGPISREAVGDASSRIDAIFADRLDGYRDRQFARGRKAP
ncbi:MAG TPA: hypothetical protein VMZ53_01195 [Kofleriaceae bacterium]|nr:hypothetical protein [Kofleriaceae bacterium]